MDYTIETAHGINRFKITAVPETLAIILKKLGLDERLAAPGYVTVYWRNGKKDLKKTIDS